MQYFTRMNAQHVDIYCFTGTGNSLRVARAAADVFEQAGRNARVLPMELVDPKTISTDHAIGLVFPIYVLTAPPLVWDFVRQLPRADGTEIFVIDTLGSFSGAVLGPLKSFLARQGYNPLGAIEIRMPENMYSVLSREKVEPLAERGLAKARIFAQKLHAGTATWQRISPLTAGFVRTVILPVSRWFFRHYSKRFRVDATKCTGCALCQTICPTKSIAMTAQHIANHNLTSRCTLCMRCISFCPTRAITMDTSSRGTYTAIDTQEFVAWLKT